MARSKNDKRGGQQSALGRGKEEAVPGGGGGPKKAKAQKGDAYVVVAGDHTDAAGRRYAKGETVYSTDDLMRMFPNKFKRGDAQPDENFTDAPGAAPPDLAEEAEVEEEDESGDESGEEGAESEEAEDVTESFPAAERQGLRVLKGEGGYEVLGDEDDPVESGLGTKAEVNKFLAARAKKRG